MAIQDVALDFEINTNNTSQELAEVELELTKIREQLKKAKAENDGTTFAKLRREQLLLQEQAKDLRKEFRNTVKDFKANTFPPDSIIALRREYRRVKQEVLELSTSDPRFKEKAREADLLADRLKDLEKSIGDTRRNVGNYEEDVTNAFETVQASFEGNLTALAAGLGAGGAVVAGIDAVTQGLIVLRDLSNQIVETRGQVQQLTGQTGEALDDTTSRVQAIANTFGQEVPDVLNAVNSLAKGFNVSIGEALDAYETGLLSGADAQGELLSNIEDFPAALETAGVSLEQFISLATTEAQEGIAGGRLLDSIREADLALKEFTDSQAEALAPLGDQFANELAEGIRTGTVTTVEAIEQIRDQSNKLGLDLQQQQRIVADVFKSGAEDAGGFEKVTNAILTGLGRNYDELVDDTNQYANAQKAALEANQEFTRAQVELAEVLGGSGSELSTLVTQLKTGFLNGLVELIRRAKEFFSIFRPLVDQFKIAGQTLGIIGENGRLSARVIQVLQINSKIAGGVIKGLVGVLTTVVGTLNRINKGVTNFARRIGIIRSQQQKTQQEVGRQRAQIEQTTQDFLNTLQKQKDETAGTAEQTDKLKDSVTDLNDETDKLKSVTEAAAKTGIAAMKVELANLNQELANAQTAEEFAKITGEIEAQERQIEKTQAQFQRYLDTQRALSQATAALPNRFGQAEGAERDDLSATDAATTVLDETGLEGQSRLARARSEEQAIADLKANFAEQAAQKQKEIREQQIEDEEAFYAAQFDLLSGAGEQFGEQIGELAANGELTLKEFAKTATLIALDTAEQVVNLALAELFAKQVAGSGFAGIAKAAILQGVIRGFTAAIFGAIRNSVSEFADGGLVTLPSGRITATPNVQTTDRGDNVLALVRTNEMILNQQQQERAKSMYGGDIWQRLGIPGFNQGGVVGGTPLLVSPSSATNRDGLTLEDAQIEQFAQTVARETSQQTADRVAEAVTRGVFEGNERSERLKNLRKQVN